MLYVAESTETRIEWVEKESYSNNFPTEPAAKAKSGIGKFSLGTQVLTSFRRGDRFTQGLCLLENTVEASAQRLKSACPGANLSCQEGSIQESR